MNGCQTKASIAKLLLVGIGSLGVNFVAQAQREPEPIDRSLQFNPGYVSPIARQTNQMSAQAATVAREAIKGEVAQIPADWRLVNVIPKANDYVMFFQAGDGSVRSLRMQADGGISGQDVVWLKAYR